MDNVANLCAIIGVTAAQAQQLLQENQGDVNNAVNQFFERGLTQADDHSKWNEDVFSAGKDGITDGSAARAFTIDGGVVGDYDYNKSSAPTRPPSRNSHHSGDSAINMSNVAIKSWSDLGLRFKTARLIHNLGVEGFGQESGVTGSSKAVFGPANKDSYYDDNQWALTVVGSQEKVPDVRANERKREEGGPAFLKPMPDGDYLPSLIAMLSTVPSIRNLLLCPQYVAQSYGKDEGWWRGTPITPPTIEVDGQPDQTDYLEFIHEVQRLIAFLDRTDRAYGSVEPLCKQEAFINAVSEDEQATSLVKFLLGWERAMDLSGLDYGLSNPLHNEVRAIGTSQKSHFLDATVIHSVPGETISLYDVLDAHMFPSNGCAFVTNLCNVLVIKLSQSDTTALKLDVEVPATFYADRYLDSNAPAVTQMLRNAAQYEEQITAINSKVNKFKFHTSKKTGKTVESLKLMEFSMKAFDERDDQDRQTLRKIQNIYKDIEVKLKELDEQKKKVREVLDEITGIFKPSPEDPNSASNGEMCNGMETIEFAKPLKEVPTFKYTLCGVATGPNIMYTRYAISDPEDKRWWRVQYQYSYDSPVLLREVVAEDVVLQRASSEHTTALLIYANPTAIHAPILDLPKPLADFVKQDNFAFMEELQKQSTDKPVWDNTHTPPHNPIMWDRPIRSDGADSDFADLGARAWLEQQAAGSTTLTPGSDGTIGEVREIEMKEVERIEKVD